MRYLPKSDSERRADAGCLRRRVRRRSVRPSARGRAPEAAAGACAGHLRIRNRRLLPPPRAPRTPTATPVFLGAGVYRALPPGAGGYGGLARRVPDLLHALPGRNLAGHAHHHLRIPDHDLPAHRHGRGQRLHVRRLHRRARSGHDGRARSPAKAACWWRAPCIPSIARCCAPTPRTRACRSKSSATSPKPAPSTSKIWSARSTT